MPAPLIENIEFQSQSDVYKSTLLNVPIKTDIFHYAEKDKNYDN